MKIRFKIFLKIEIENQVVMKAANPMMTRRSKDFQKGLSGWSNIMVSILRTLVVQQGRAEQTQAVSA